MTFDEWALRHPAAAADLAQCFAPDPGPQEDSGHSEAWAQQRVRLQAAHAGAFTWRNNVGVLRDERGVPVRFGLANDSARVNERIKSSDLIMGIPRVVTADMVGDKILQFGSAECKAPGWRYRGTPREKAQLAWLALIQQAGGFATFSTGEITL